MAKQEDIIITPSYVSVLTKEQDDKTVYVIREASENKGLEQTILGKVADPTKITFVYDPAGPSEAHTPLYDLVMRDTGTSETLEPVKPDVSAHFELDEAVVKATRKNYSRHIPFEFEIGEQTYICETDMNNDGGLANSSTFFLLEKDEPRFMFWTRKQVDSPEIAEYLMREYLTKHNDQTYQPDEEQPSKGDTGTSKDLDIPKAGDVLSEERVVPIKRKPKKQRWSYQTHTRIEDETQKTYGILRLEQPDGMLKSYGIPFKGEVTFLDLRSEKVKSLTIFDYGLSKPIWLDVNKELEANGVKHIYKTVDQGTYEVTNPDKQIIKLSGTVINGSYIFTENSITLEEGGER